MSETRRPAVGIRSLPRLKSWGGELFWLVVSVLLGALALIPNATLFSSPTVGLIMSVAQALPIALMRHWPTTAFAVYCVVVLATSAAAPGIYAPWSWASIVVGLLVVAFVAGRVSAVGAAGMVAVTAAVWSVAVIRHGMPIGYYLVGAAFVAAVVAVVRMRVRLRQTSERLRNEERLREVADVRRMATEQHAELSGRVHDIVGHRLAVISLMASAEGGRASSMSEKDRVLSEISSTAAVALSEVRAVLDGQPDDAVDFDDDPDSGGESLLQLVTEWSEVGVLIEHSGFEALNGAGAGLRREAYMVVRQALTNAVQHGATREVTIVVTEDQDLVGLRISNKAVGDEVHPGRGLTGMKSRLARRGHDMSVTVTAGVFELLVELDKEA